MRTGGRSGQRQHYFLVVLFIAMLTDGILLAIVRANTLHTRAYDLHPLHRTSANLPPPL